MVVLGVHGLGAETVDSHSAVTLRLDSWEKSSVVPMVGSYFEACFLHNPVDPLVV